MQAYAVLTHRDMFVGGILTIILCIAHYLSPQLSKIKGINPTQLISFAAGVTVGYVFLHMLPELADSHDVIKKVLDASTSWWSQFDDLLAFFLALVGFEVYYLLTYLGERMSLRNDGSEQRMFKYAIGFYFIYNFLITYTLMYRIDNNYLYSTLFTLAMALHFVLTDHEMRRTYPVLFIDKYRFILLTGLITGYIISVILPISTFATSLFLAFLCGGILCVSFAEEVSITKKTRIRYFFVGSFVMSVILAAALIHSA